LHGPLRWLSGQGIGPSKVTREDLERFLELTCAQSLCPKPEEVCRRLIAAWNDATSRVPGWPPIILQWTSRLTVRSLSWADLQPEFKADVDRWFARQSGDDIMAEDAPPRPWKPVTLKSREGIIRTCAWSLVQKGVPVDAIRSLADLVRLDNFRLILANLWERTGKKPSATLVRRADMLISIARHHVGLEKAAIDALRKAAHRLTPDVVGLTQKNRDRLRPFDDAATITRLVRLPFEMRRTVESGRLTPVRAAQQAERAVAIAILLNAPIRIKNLRQIEIGKHLRRHGQSLMLTFIESEVKNAVPLRFEFDGDVARLIQWYIDEHRPLLAGARSAAFLFPGNDGGACSESGLSAPISRAVRKNLGLEINPHLFRHIAAKVYLDAYPGQYEVVRQLLGHKSIATTTNFYVGFESKAATKLYQGVVAKMVQQGAPA
jgi:integrase